MAKTRRNTRKMYKNKKTVRRLKKGGVWPPLPPKHTNMNRMLKAAKEKAKYTGTSTFRRINSNNNIAALNKAVNNGSLNAMTNSEIQKALNMKYGMKY